MYYKYIGMHMCFNVHMNMFTCIYVFVYMLYMEYIYMWNEIFGGCGVKEEGGKYGDGGGPLLSPHVVGGYSNRN